MQNCIGRLINYLHGNANLHLQQLSNSNIHCNLVKTMKRAFSSRESSRKLLTCDPKTILQLMDEFSSEEDSELEFDGYITDENVKDEVDCKNDASNRFFFSK